MKSYRRTKAVAKAAAAAIYFFLFQGQVIAQNYSLQFDGVDDYVEVPDAASLDITAALTLEAWIKLQGAPADFQPIINKANPDANQRSYALFVSADMSLVMGVSEIGDDYNALVASSFPLKLGVWQHAVGVYEDGALRVYIDGQLAGEETVGIPASLHSGTATMNLGTYSNAETSGEGSVSDALNMELDEVRIWSTARTKNEIVSAMFGELSGGELNLEAYYKFDENTGIVVGDATANANDGILRDNNYATNSADGVGFGPLWADPSGAFTPILYQASNISSSGFTLNWLPIANASTVFYNLDDNSDFSSPVISSASVTNTNGGSEVVAQDLSSYLNTPLYLSINYDDGGPSPFSNTMQFMVTPGNTLDFDGTDDRVIIPYSPTLDLTNQFTYEFWFKSNNLSQSQSYIMDKDNIISIIFEYVGNTIELYGSFAGTSPRSVSGIVINDTDWHHVAYSYDGATLNGYLDGAHIINESILFSIDHQSTTDEYFLGSSTSVANFLSGQLDEFRMWSVARSTAEIQDYLYTTLSGAEEGLVAYYQFDEGDAGATNTGITTLPDLSINGHHGTLSNFQLDFAASNWLTSGAMQPPPYTVVNTHDDGSGSLRQAIIDANASGSKETITFAIPGSGPWTINLVTQLPNITRSMAIDGKSQPGWDFATENMVTLNLAGVTNGDGFTIASPDVDIFGLKIVNADFGILINGETYDNAVIEDNIINNNITTAINIVNADNITIQGNHIGVTGDGLSNQATSGIGIAASSSDNLVIGGDRTLGEGNHMAGSAVSSYLINISGSTGVTLEGNLLGSSLTGADITTSRGINITTTSNLTIGNADPNRRNYIAGIDNIAAIAVSTGDQIDIVNNYVGVGLADTYTIGNSITGVGGLVLTGATNFTIDGNVVGGSADDGIEIGGVSNTGSIINNLIGVAPDGVTSFGNGTYGINIVSATVTTTTIGGVGAENTVAFNGSGGIRTSQTSFGTSAISANSIFCNTGLGINISGTSVVATPVITSVSPTEISGTSTAEDGANILIFESEDGCADNQGKILLAEFANAVSGGMWAVSGSFDEMTPYTAIVDDDESSVDGIFGVSEFSAPYFTDQFTVTSTADAGAGSLRQAILDANASLAAKSVIDFNIAGGGPWVISPLTVLPTLDNTVDASIAIDATTQPGWVFGDPNSMVILDGTSVSNLNCFYITESDVEIYGLVINGFFNGLWVNGGSHNLIIGKPGKGNIIKGNTGSAVISSGASNDQIIQGNYFGLSIDGLSVDANLGSGLFISGDNILIGGNSLAGEGNVISGNGSGGLEYGIQFDNGPNAQIFGNLIGTDKNGENALGNLRGIRIEAGDDFVVIGGQGVGQGNVISGTFSAFSVHLVGGSNTIVDSNIIGLNSSGTTAIGNVGNGIDIVSGIGLGAIIQNNVISASNESGIAVAGTSDVIIQNNFIGTSAAGNFGSGMANLGHGIAFGLANGVNNTSQQIKVEDNVISGNGDTAGDNGINFAGANSNILIQSNKIGAEFGGPTPLPNTGEGIDFSNTTTDVTVGGVGFENIIVYNAGSGIFFTGSDNSNGNLIDINIVACNVGGGISFANTAIVDAPVINQITGTEISGTSTTADATNVDVYRVDASCADDQGAFYLGSTTVTGGVWNFLTSVAGGESYVAIVNDVSIGLSEFSSQAALSPPISPSNLQTVEISSTQIDLAWTDNSSDETDFAIFRSDGNNVTFSEIATVTADATTYIDNTVTVDNSYFYYVVARNANGDSAPSSEKSGNTRTPPGNAFNFDGVAQFIAPDISGALSALTVEAWVWASTSQGGGEGMLVSQATLGTAAGWELWRQGSNFYFSFKSSDANTYFASAPLTTNVWQHVAAVWDGTETTVYVNGVPGAAVPTVGNIPDNSINFVIGNNSSGARPSIGLLDEVRVWDDARTQPEILGNIAVPLTGSESNLLAYYRFDQGIANGNNTSPPVNLLPDRSLNNHDATLTGAVLNGSVASNWVPSSGLDASVLNNSLSFDGVDDVVHLPHFSRPEPLTIEAFIRTSSFNSPQTIVAWGGINDYSILRLDNGYLSYTEYYEFGDPATTITFDRYALNDDQWYHVAVVREGNMSNNATLFVNGAPVKTGTVNGQFHTTSALDIGSWNNNGTPVDFFEGMIEEVRIWDAARTPIELQTNMTVELAGNEADLRAYYQFNEGSAGSDNTGITTLPDISPNGVDGTLANFTLNGSSSNWVTSDGFAEVAPGSPTAVVTNEVSDSQININWEDNSLSETGFSIERADFDKSTYSQIGAVAANQTFYSDVTVLPETGYYYRVMASGATNNSMPSREKYGTTITAPGNSLSFDGVDDYVDLGDPDYSGLGAFTVEAWIKPSYIPSGPGDETMTIIGKGATSVEGTTTFAIVLEGSDSGGELFGLVDNGSTIEVARFDGGNGFDLFPDEWRHVAMTWIADGPVTLFVDGVEVDATANLSGPLNVVSEHLLLGSGTDINEINYEGEIDEVRIWNYRRSDIDLQAEMFNTIDGGEEGLLANYRFDQGIAGANNADPAIEFLPDRTPNTSDGELIGFTLMGPTSNWLTSGALTAPVTSYLTYSSSINISSQVTYDNTPFGIIGEEATIQDIDFSWDGTKMFIVGTGGDEVNQYSLATPFETTTGVTHDGFFDLSGQETAPYGLAFNRNGTRMYVIGDGSGSGFVSQYSLTDPFEITSGVTFDGNAEVSAEGSFPRGMALSRDGAKLFIVNNGDDEVNQYSLSSPYDITSGITFDSQLVDVSAQTTTPEEIAFNIEGSKIFIMSRGDRKVYEYLLTNPFDFSGGAIYSGVFRSVLSQESFPTGLAFSSPGDKMYVVGTAGDKVNQYTLSGESFKEDPLDNGVVNGSAVISVAGGETFSNSGSRLTYGVDYSISNLPTGLIPDLAIATDGLSGVLTFSGSASPNDDAEDVTDLIFTFEDAAFVEGGAATVAGSTGASSNLSIEFFEGTQVVTTTADSGPGSLRQAILNVENTTDPVTISFNLPGDGSGTSWTISPDTELPLLTNTNYKLIIIDGTTQPGWDRATDRMIVIDGEGSLGRGLSLVSYSSSEGLEVYGLKIRGFDYGIYADYLEFATIGALGKSNVLSGNVTGFYGQYANSNNISYNYVGTDVTGSSADPNDIGIDFGYTYSESYDNYFTNNVISGNTNIGLAISYSTDFIQNNKIGVSDDESTAIPNDIGLWAAGRGVVEDNIISGNITAGVLLQSPGNTNELQFYRNYIGTNSSDTPIPNGVGISSTPDPGSPYNPPIIGDFDPTNGNIIAYNVGAAVQLNGQGYTNVKILTNSIYENGLGIQLLNGADGGEPGPEITNVSPGSISGTMESYADALIHLYEVDPVTGKQGKTIIDSLNAPTQTTWTISNGLIDPTKGYVVTQTSNTFGTTEFSAPSSNYALDFDGSDDYVSVPDAVGLRIPTDITLEAWVRRKSFGIDIILEKGGDWTTGTNYGLGLHNINNNMFYFFWNGGWKGTSGPSDDNWHHYAAVAHDGNTEPQFYIDGVLQPVEFSSGVSTIDLDETATEALHIGAQVESGLNYFGNNDIDEVRVWNTQRTASEIANNYYQTLDGNETGLVAYFDLNDGYGSTTAFDLSANGYVGTLTTMDPNTDWVVSGALIPPFAVTEATPAPNAIGVPLASTINFTFSDPVDGVTWNPGNVYVRGDQTGLLPVSFSGGGSTSLTIDPLIDFQPGEIIRVTLTTAVASTSGRPLWRPYTFEFRAASANGPETPDFFADLPENHVTTSQLAETVFAVDIDSDGDMDIVAGMQADQISWFENDGSQGFTEHIVDNVVGILDVGAADINSDGSVDLFAQGDGSLNWFENDGSEGFTIHEVDDLGGSNSLGQSQAVDLDGDGDMDFVVAYTDFDEVAWYENDGAENFTKIVIDNVALEAYTVWPVDVNSDGLMDVVATHSENIIAIYNNDGYQNFSKEAIYVPWTASHVGVAGYAADFDGDLDVDLIFSNSGGFDDVWLENDGSGAFTQNNFPGLTGGDTYLMVDLDGDGDMDDIVATAADGIYWDENDGGQNFTSHEIALIQDWVDIFPVDMDNDGDLDVVATFGELMWFENTANPPNPASDLIIAEISNTSILLSWTDNSSDEEEFIIERAGYDRLNFELFDNVPANQTSYLLEGLSPGEGYYYRVVASKSSGVSEPSNDEFGSTIVPPGHALDFDGVDDAVLLGNPEELNFGSAFTFETWAYIKALPPISTQFIYLYTQVEDAVEDNSVAVDNLGNVRLYVHGLGQAVVISSNTIQLNQWTHIAATYEDGIGLKIYINGVLEGFTASSGIPVAGVGNSYLGSDPERAIDGSNFPLNGRMDEARIWDIARSEAEIQSTLFGSVDADAPNLVAYYRFDQGLAEGNNLDPSIDFLPDRSSNMIDGTLLDFSLNGSSSNWVTSTAFGGGSFVVTNTDDSGAGSLREAVDSALPGATITFSLPPDSEILLSSTELGLNKTLFIDGSDVPGLKIYPPELLRLFSVLSDGNLYLSNLHLTRIDVNEANGGMILTLGNLILNNVTIDNSDAGGAFGGAIFASDAASVTLVSSAITNCNANRGGAIALFDDASLSISNSNIESNTAFEGGAIYDFSTGNTAIIESTMKLNAAGLDGGAVHHSGAGDFSIVGALFHQNSAVNLGGAIFTSNGELTIYNTTISSNDADGGGALFASNPGVVGITNGTIYSNSGNSTSGVLADAPLTMQNSILANQPPSSGFYELIADFTSLDYNFISVGDDITTSGFGTSDIVGSVALPGDPGLGPLANNGGLIYTHLPQFGSPVIDAGNPGFFSVPDQRGYARDADPDIGAVDSEGTPPDGVVIITVSATDQSSCLSPSGELTAFATTSGGIEPVGLYTFTWYSGNEAIPGNELATNAALAGSAGLTISALAAGTYTIEVVNNDLASVSVSTVAIVDNLTLPIVTVGNVAQANETVAGASDGSLDATGSVAGGSGDYSYEWFQGTNSGGTLLGTAISMLGLTAGDYAFRVTDNVSGCFSAEEVFTINVSGVAPAVDTNTGIVLNQGAAHTLLLTELAASDADTPPLTSLIYTITTTPTFGAILVEGVEASSFSQQDLVDGLVAYQHDGTENFTDSFDFELSDGTSTLPSQTVNITITPVVVVPFELTSLSASEVTSGTFRANWDSLPNGTGYLLEVATDALFANLIAGFNPQVVTDTTSVIPNLYHATDYFYRVRGYTASDTTGYSDTVRVRTLQSADLIADSVALVKMFDQMGGASWVNSDNWMSGQVRSWYGVLVENNRATALNLPSNNVTGAFPVLEGTQLNTLLQLDLSNNAVSGVGSGANLAALQTLNLANNSLDFASLEPFVAVPDFSYSPQLDVLGAVDILQERGDPINLDRTIGGTANVYVWFKNGVPIDGQSNATYAIDFPTFADEGNYAVQVTNTLLPDLTLNSLAIALRVSSLERDKLILTELYNLTDGDNWIQNTGWGAEDVTTWFGITVTSDRVTGIDLPANNLNGDLPSTLADMRKLTAIDVSDNEIASIPELTNIIELSTLNVANNKLHFDDLEPNVGIAGIVYSPQKLTGTKKRELVPVNSSYTVDLPVGGSANTYQWFRNGVALDGATLGQYAISSLAYSNMGNYELEVTSSLVPGLTLKSEVQEILATATLSGAITDRNSSPVGNAFGALLGIRSGAYDTTRNYENEASGTFVINDVVLGNYLLYAEQDIQVFLPSYYKSTIDWAFADLLEVRGNLSGLTIAMENVPSVLTPADGDNTFSGLFESDFGDDEGRVFDRKRVKGAGVSVSRSRFRAKENDDDYELIAYVQTDENGEFEMNNLPDGDYRLNIQYPGIPMDPASFIDFQLGGGSGVEQNSIKVNAFASPESIVVTKVEETGIYLDYFKGLTVYPNPAADYITIRYEKLVKGNVIAELMDLTGRAVMSEEVRQGTNRQTVLDLTDVKNGLYILRFFDKDMNGVEIASFRLIVKK
ncbi:MAG: LamG-like jellyroll fold domain-containing protein [Imperialibacter sp.]|uniref:LamG-like jellyroll fold domain-containing protein n=1 Tax=Imperialibacter sp. TaxID=2038411 RepID=UPI0032EE5D84